MDTYVLLLHPGHNRVYFKSAKELAAAEISFVARRMETPLSDIRFQEIAGLSCLTFDASKTLGDADLCQIARLSFAYAFFRLGSQNGQTVLFPVRLPDDSFLPSDISTHLKYPGKTNERFTRLMINVGLAAGAHDGETRIRLLDPLAGKGTTLFDGLSLGFDVWGIEQSKKIVHEAVIFLKKFLESERMKHTTVTETLHAGGESAGKTAFDIAKTKADFAAGNRRACVLVAGDARLADAYAKKTRFHLIVGDLPYGIQHESRTQESRRSSKNPANLLEECLPAWHRILLPGGAMVLAYNTLLLSPADMEKTVSAAGFAVHPAAPPRAFAHRVDQAINRDILIATRP